MILKEQIVTRDVRIKQIVTPEENKKKDYIELQKGRLGDDEIAIAFFPIEFENLRWYQRVFSMWGIGHKEFSKWKDNEKNMFIIKNNKEIQLKKGDVIKLTYKIEINIEKENVIREEIKKN